MHAYKIKNIFITSYHQILTSKVMKILVCISNVPDTTSKINFTNNDTQFDTAGVQYVINPNDEYGLTRAMWFKEQQGATVHVLSVGEADCENTLRKALAIGADDAIRINTKPTDSFSVATQIFEAIKGENYDLIIAGKESIDYNGGMVPGTLAAMLNVPFVNACSNLIIEGTTAKVSREMDGGKENLTCNLPLVIAGQKGIVEEKDLRIPNMRGIMTARTKVIKVIEPQNLEAKIETLSFEKPAPKQAVKLINPDNIDELIHLLHNEAKVI